MQLKRQVGDVVAFGKAFDMAWELYSMQAKSFVGREVDVLRHFRLKAKSICCAKRKDGIKVK